MSSEAARKLLISDSGKLKLEYFAIEGVAQATRLALTVADVPFDDVHVTWDQWAAKKASTKYGMLPEMILPDGTLVTQSGAMLRLAAEADPTGKLFPADVMKRTKVEEVMGLVGDLTRAWSPSLYVSMRPHFFGYPTADEWDKDEKEATVKKVREQFMSVDFPKFMGFFTNLIKEHGEKFLCGEDMTIADIMAYQQIAYFGKGIADHVPKDCLDEYKEIGAWMGRIEANPKIAAFQSKK